MAKQEFPYVSHFRDRHGKLRWRYRREGKSVALGTDYGSPEFLRRLNAATRGERLPVGEATRKVHSGSSPGSLAAVIVSWYSSADYRNLSAITKYQYKNVAEKLREQHGTKSVLTLERRHIKDMMADKAETPAAANWILRIMRMVLAHAVEIDVLTVNPAAGIKKYATNPDGYHTWTEDEIAAYYTIHLPGSLAHTAMTLMLYTGAARGDAVLLGHTSIRNGRLQYRRKKMQGRAGVLIDIPMHPSLERCVTALPKDHQTFLQTQAGAGRSADGLGNLMREWCNDAALPECSSHGLRKACARRLIEAGATPHELMAVTGHKTLAQAQKYADTFNRAAAADRAFERMS